MKMTHSHTQFNFWVQEATTPAGGPQANVDKKKLRKQNKEN